MFDKTFIAAACLAAGSAIAATPAAQIAISSGASASKNNLKLALVNRCPATLAEYVSGGNISTYVCATGTFSGTPTAAEYNASTPVKFTGTDHAELRLNVNGGSFTAVCLLAGWPGGTACPAPDTYLDPATGALAAAPGGSGVIGGLMDVEPNGFLSIVRTGIANPASVVTAGFGQTFGVAVSNDLYNAMFADQQASLGLNCQVSDTARPECVPVIGKAQMAAIMSSNSSNAAYTNGANFLAPSVPAGTNLSYLRRVDTSGTQAAGQQYFLGNVCNPAGLSVVPQGASTGTAVGAITVFGLETTGNVRTELNKAGYSVAIISGENNQTGQSWKWLRVGGMNLGESSAPAQGGVTFTNTATAKAGQYDYWFLSRIAQPSSSASNPAVKFWTSVKTGFAAVPAGNTKGLFATTETLFTRGAANSCTPVTSN